MSGRVNRSGRVRLPALGGACHRFARRPAHVRCVRGCGCGSRAFSRSGWGQVRRVEERLEAAALIVRAIDLTIAEVEARDARDRDEQLATLTRMRDRWREKAADESDG